MTEDQAKTKWCPFVRTGLTAGMSVNRHVADAPDAQDGVWAETRCIGSECMAWRWRVTNIGRNTGHGSCGLAGRPTTVSE